MALAVALCAGLWRFSRPRVSLPTDPRRYVPAGARLVVTLDVSRVLSSGRLARWVAPRAGEGCEAGIARRVKRLVLVSPRVPVEGFAVAAQGDFTRDALIACARSRGGRYVTERETRDGVEVLRVVAQNPSGQPTSEVAWLPGGLVLAGEPAVVRAMIDAAWPGRSDGADVMAVERARVAEGRAGAVSAVLDGDNPESPWLRGVRGVALGADMEGGLSGEAVLACADARGAEATAAGLRSELGLRVELAPIDALRASAGVVVRGREVRVRFGIGDQGTDALVETLSGTFDALARRVGER